MAIYSPPTEQLPIFDSSVFKNDDLALTIGNAKKMFLRYPNAQGTENLQSINVGGLATFTTPSNGTAIIVNASSGYSNTGLTLNNIGIYQTGVGNQNYMNSIDLNSNANLNIGSITSKINYNGFNNNLDEYLQQYVDNTGSYIWEYISTTAQTILNLNPTSGMTISPPIFSTYTMPAIDDSSTRIPTTNWVQDLIASFPTPVNLPNINFLGITASGTGSPSNSGISNMYNSGALVSKSSGNVTGYGSTGFYTSSSPISIIFKNDINGPPAINISCEFKINIFFFNPSTGAYGQTSFNLLIFPQALESGAPLANWGSPTSTIYNVNNKINNDSSFIITGQPTYAPYGRQYWTYNQQFSGSSGANGYFLGVNNGAGSYSVKFYPIFPTIVYYSMTCEILNSNGTNSLNNGVNISM